MWSPSSLIFLVLLGVWAAYFLQYWIRRRDHLATARSVEQFSEAMRVLERRDSTPRTDLSEPAPRSWNVHPGRAATRPQVLVKRAVPSEPVSPVLTERVDRTADEAVPSRPERTPRPPAPRRPEAPAARTPRPTSQEPRRVRPSRRVRALLMLVAFAELAGIAVLVPLGYLEWWALAPAVVALVASFAYVRAGVRAEQRLRAARRQRAAVSRSADTASRAERATRTSASRPSASARPTTEDRSVPVAEPFSAVASASDSPVQEPAAGLARQADPAAEQPVAEQPVAEQPVAEQPVAEQPAAEAPVVEPAVPEEPEHIEYVHLVDEDDIPLTWEPVPVPRPTYTMKARAERPEVPPAEVTPDAAPVELPAEGGLPERRVAGA